MYPLPYNVKDSRLFYKIDHSDLVWQLVSDNLEIGATWYRPKHTGNHPLPYSNYSDPYEKVCSNWKVLLLMLFNYNQRWNIQYMSEQNIINYTINIFGF